MQWHNVCTLFVHARVRVRNGTIHSRSNIVEG